MFLMLLKQLPKYGKILFFRGGGYQKKSQFKGGVLLEGGSKIIFKGGVGLSQKGSIKP